ncbi:hypothetical protein HY501_03390 [Candidatus Woesearchaeota archaeon]|nr:hypothetical protein [Candidatus Woesearchaeota archaeon]
MEIREALFKKSFSVESKDPYGLSLDFMKRMSENYMVYERKNLLETDGPSRRSSLVFDVVENLDDFSRIIVNISMDGENGTLYVNLEAEFVLHIREHGFFTDIFTEFYLNNVFPVLRQASEQRAREMKEELDIA